MSLMPMPMRYPSDADADADARIVALLHTHTHTRTHVRSPPLLGLLQRAKSREHNPRSAAQRPLCFRWRCSRERERDTRVKLYTRRTFDLAARPIRGPHREPSRAEVRAVIHPRPEPSGEQKPRLGGPRAQHSSRPAEPRALIPALIWLVRPRSHLAAGSDRR